MPTSRPEASSWLTRATSTKPKKGKITMLKKSTSDKRSRREGFEYKSRPAEKWKAKASEGAGNYDRYLADGTTRFSPKDGTNRIRILPPTWDDPDDFAFQMHTHFSVGPEEQTYLCPKQMRAETCPVCDEVARLQKEGEKDDATSLRAKKRFGVWLIDRKAEEDGPQFWATPFGVHHDACVGAEDEEGQILELDHPQDGYDIIFTKEGQGNRTNYNGVRLSRKPSPISEDEDLAKEWLSSIQKHPLPSVLKIYDPGYIWGGFSGAPKEEKEEKENVQPTKKKAAQAEDQQDLSELADRLDDMTYDDIVEAVQKNGLEVDVDDYADPS